MTPSRECIGIVGGNGALGSAIARALRRSGAAAAGGVAVSCRSGAAPALADWPDIAVTPANRDLAGRCGVLVLAVPPAAAGALDLQAPDALVISVMAGVPAARIAALTGARAVIRAMSSPPAADLGRAFSPFWAGPGATAADRAVAHRVLGACGETAEVATEDLIDRFTALTGPVPGFLAAFAQAVQAYAEKHGAPPEIAVQAALALCRAGGEIMDASGRAPAAHVDEMIAYAGTTAAGLRALQDGPFGAALEAGFDAAVRKARDLGEG